MLSLDEVLDECLTRLARGEPLRWVVDRYPAYARELMPLLEMAEELWRVRLPQPSREAYEAGRAEMLTALDRKDAKRSRRRFAWAVSLGGVALVVLITGLFALQYRLPFDIRFGAGPDDHSAQVAMAAGTVLRLPAQATIWEPLNAGDTVLPGERVQTAGSGSTELRFADGTVAELSPNTEIAVAGVATTETPGSPANVIYVERGEVAYDTPESEGSATPRRHLEVRTASAVAVPETPGRFSMTVSSAGATLLEADTGQVSLTSASGEIQVVKPGHSAEVAASSSRPEQPPGQEKQEPGPAGSVATPTPTPRAHPSQGTQPTPKPSHTPKPTHTPKPSRDTGPPVEPPGQSGRDHVPPGQSNKDKDK